MVLECVGRSLLRFCLVWGGGILVQRMPCMFVERCFLISFEDLVFLEEKIARMACVEWRFRNYGNPCGINSSVSHSVGLYRKNHLVRIGSRFARSFLWHGI